MKKRETGERQKTYEENKEILTKLRQLEVDVGSIDEAATKRYLDRLRKEGSGK